MQTAAWLKTSRVYAACARFCSQPDRNLTVSPCHDQTGHIKHVWYSSWTGGSCFAVECGHCCHHPTVTQFMDGRYRQVVKSDDSCIKSKWQSPCWHHNQSEWIRSQFGMCSKPMTRLWQDMTRRTWLPPNQLLSTCGEMPWVAVASVQCVSVWIHTPQVVQWPPAKHT